MRQSTAFIADIHLCEEQPAITQAFIHFIEKEAPQLDSLYILGDLFDYWIGDDATSPYHEYIMKKLYTLSTKTAWYFLPGNRDFLIGDYFAKATGCTLLPEIAIREIQGHRVLLTHGDLLVQQDYGYRVFRYFVQNPLNKKLFLSLPATWRTYIARTLRSASYNATQKKTDRHFTVSFDAIHKTLSKQDAQLLIHGHIHRLSIQNSIGFMRNPFIALSLPDWRGDEQRVLLVDQGNVWVETV